MKRSTIHYIWPWAESKIYEELKRLGAAGYATATPIRRMHAGRADAITSAGRHALRRWVAEPGTGVFFESEGALQILFAENGTKEQLLATINSIRVHALASSSVGHVYSTKSFATARRFPTGSIRACWSSTSSTA